MRVKVWSKFHGREAVIAVKDVYAGEKRVIDDSLLVNLCYEVYSNGDDKAYARRKLTEIRRKVCGARDCKCAVTVKKAGKSPR